MQTVPVTRQHLLGSVIAVPPLARNEDYTLNREANRALIRHIEAGGVGVWPFEAVAGERAVDEPGVTSGKNLVAEA